MTKKNLLDKLKAWQSAQAKKEGVEPYRIVPFATLETIAHVAPQTKEELCAIRGFKEARFHKYGRAILALTGAPAQGISPEQEVHLRTWGQSSFFDEAESVETVLNSGAVHRGEKMSSDQEHKEAVYSVGVFLDRVNTRLSSCGARVKGEVVSVDVRERVVYFTLKDQEDGSVLNCLIFRNHYDISGVSMEEGMMVIVDGAPEVYKPTGRLSMKVFAIELAGEGALKRAYEELKRKLSAEGLFAPERKRALPQLSQRIGVITSRQGAAIHDFLTNIGQFGYHLFFVNTAVEGKRAVLELLHAVQQFQKKDIDVLVLVRGGGSMESLQAFNNEQLARALATFPVPVIVGVGHEQDETIATLVADVGVSTPTAAARAVRQSWDEAVQRVAHNERFLVATHEKHLSAMRMRIEHAAQTLTSVMERTRMHVVQLSAALTRAMERVHAAIAASKERLSFFEKTFAAHDPARQLRLGYSIATVSGKIVREVNDVQKDAKMNVRVSDGTIETAVRSSVRHKEKNYE